MVAPRGYAMAMPQATQPPVRTVAAAPVATPMAPPETMRCWVSSILLQLARLSRPSATTIQIGS